MTLGPTDLVIELSIRSKDARCLGLKTLPLSCADFLEIVGFSTSWRPNGVFVQGLFLPQSQKVSTLILNDLRTSNLKPLIHSNLSLSFLILFLKQYILFIS
jgi:hypothetical protein